MDIQDLTLKQIRQVVREFGGGSESDATDVRKSAWEIGKIYLIRTVTMIDTGRLVDYSDHELVLEDAAWIADTGRFMQAVESAEFDEVEPFPNGRVIIGRGSIIDAVEIQKTPRFQK